jgi:hypothetical protein
MAPIPVFKYLKTWLVKEQILLLSFTVDHLGGIVGTLAYCLLFGPDENKAPKPTTNPPLNCNRSLLLYNMAYGKNAPTDLLQ